MSRISLRLLIPLTMASFALLIVVFSFVFSQRIILSRVERIHLIQVKDRMNALQGTLEKMHALGDQDAVQQTLSLYGAAADHGILLLTDPAGLIIASTRYQDIGQHWTGLGTPMQRTIIETILSKQALIVRLSEDRRWIDAYVSVFQAGPQRLRNRSWGVLYYRRNLQYHKRIALADVHNMVLLIGAGSVLSACLVWILLHKHLTTRTVHIIETLGRYQQGERNLQITVPGRDELADIARSISAMVRQLQQDEMLIRESEERFRTLVRNIPGVVYRCETGSPRKMLFLSNGIEKLCGYSAAELLDKATLSYSNLIHPEERQHIEEEIYSHTQRQESFVLEYRIRDAHGIQRWVLDRGQVVADGRDTMKYIDGIILDITEKKTAEMLAQNQQKMLQAMSLAAHDAIIMIDAHDTILFWNKAAEQLYGYQASEVIGHKKLHELICAPQDQESAYQGLKHFADSGTGPVLGSVMEFQSVHQSGRPFPVERSVAAFQMDDVWYAVGSIRDITKRKKAEEALHKLATTDSLTSLNNRRNFLELSSHEFLRTKRYAESFSVLMFDVDYFKSVNDTYGHDIGDKVLKSISHQVMHNIRETDIIGRLGGEEFAVTMPNTGSEQAGILAERLRTVVSAQTIPTEKGDLRVTISIGAATMTQETEDIESLLKIADNALYTAKNSGRNCVIIA